MTTQGINTFNEKSLHLALKAWYAQPDDQLEVPLDGYIIDLVRGDLLVEFQTRNFAAIRVKLTKLLPRHPIRLIFPIAQEKWIVKLDPTQPQSRRKSPKTGVIEHLFDELVYIPTLLRDPNFSLEVLLIHEEELRRPNEHFRWRRRPWITEERRLLRVVRHYHFVTPYDLLQLLPPTLNQPFTTADLAAASGQPRAIAQKMVYCLAKMEMLQLVGKQRNALLYQQVLSNCLCADAQPEALSDDLCAGAQQEALSDDLCADAQPEALSDDLCAGAQPVDLAADLCADAQPVVRGAG